MNILNKNEFLEKYAEVEVKFLAYGNYKFTFGGTLADGRYIIVVSGGSCPKDIPGSRIEANKWIKVKDIKIILARIHHNNEEIEEYCAGIDENGRWLTD